MKNIKVSLDKRLLKAADSAPKGRKVSRSALIREALERHLKYLQLQETQDRWGYLAKPEREEQYRCWEDVAAWPRW